MESEKIPEENKKELRNLYQSLNPAELKRRIDEKIHRLFKVYEEKQGRTEPSPSKNKLLGLKQKVTFSMAERPQLRLPD